MGCSNGICRKRILFSPQNLLLTKAFDSTDVQLCKPKLEAFLLLYSLPHCSPPPPTITIPKQVLSALPLKYIWIPVTPLRLHHDHLSPHLSLLCPGLLNTLLTGPSASCLSQAHLSGHGPFCS